MCPLLRDPCIPRMAANCPMFTPSLPSLRAQIQQKLGTFPLFEFWGPRTSINSTRWIAESARYVEEQFHPTLTFVYLPHLDYNLQRLGPESAAIAVDLAAVDGVAADLIDFYEARGSGFLHFPSTASFRSIRRYI